MAGGRGGGVLQGVGWRREARRGGAAGRRPQGCHPEDTGTHKHTMPLRAPPPACQVTMFDKGSEAWIKLLAQLGKMGREGVRGGSGVVGGGDGHVDINKSKVEL